MPIEMNMKSILALMQEISNNSDLSALTDEKKLEVAMFVLEHGGHPTARAEDLFPQAKLEGDDHA